jgi:superfamily II DNA or RNA helicase
MSLSKSLKPIFNTGDRNRGAAYFSRGKVFEMTVKDGFIFADVDGSYGSYEVIIELDNIRDGDEDAIVCTCPRFEGGHYCKHIWAAILKYDSVYGNSSPSSQPRTTRRVSKTVEKKKAKSIPAWQTLLDHAKTFGRAGRAHDRHGKSQSLFQVAIGQKTEVLYVVDAASNSRYGPDNIELSVFQRTTKKNGQWGVLKPLNLSHDSLHEIPAEIDRKIATQLLGADRKYSNSYSYGSYRTSFSDFEIEPTWSPLLCDLLVKTERFYWALDPALPMEDFYRIESIDFATPTAICIDVRDKNAKQRVGVMDVAIKKDGVQIDRDQVVKIAENGTCLLTDRLVHIGNPKAIELWNFAQNNPPVEIKQKERETFLKQLSENSSLPRIDLPVSWQVKQSNQLVPIATLRLHPHHRNENELCGDVVFTYQGHEFPLGSNNSAAYDEDNNCWIERNSEQESKLLQQIVSFPIVDTSLERFADHDFRIHKKHLVRIVDELGNQQWKVHFLGKPFKQAGEFSISVESGQDWFDLSAKVSFDGETIPLPGLLQAISKKEHFVTLADGSRGRIPTEMIEKYARLAKFGRVEDDKIRFRPTQAMLLDAMLVDQQVSVDKGFKDFRKKLRSFSGVKPKSPPRGFQGKLRKYQSEGLGWLHFLREFNLGGCLADDMGLGKTIQVLSLLESRRTRRITVPCSTTKVKKTAKSKADKKAELVPTIVSAATQLKRKPSIVVVPKSLIFNWIEEGAKFTPRLRILNYTGTARRENIEEAISMGGFDVLLTTYGTMRKDISELSQVEFDYAILDESQAIKNSKAQCAKSSRLIRADHRLAMTGTPIENHLGELWSLFEFLNPGMLGGSTNFARLTNQKKSNEFEREETLNALSKAISPFLLRRTKEQVLTDLPPKTEQTLYCDMLPPQKKAYNELKEYYRVKLAKKVETDGIGRSKIQVLEALLRLRQVACDPRLLDDKAKPGAKLELLQRQIAEIVSEGHKVLVFSQFTSLLSLVKQQFDEAEIKYEYLDGKSSKRASSVKRFQQDESVSAFLISIKAGAHGLNLTAADYVFLLDPWWNPAVEAQAIDRAHRMGQKNPVIAYRMICRDTVEEKIVSLQQSKRDLADRIVRSDESLIRSLTADDLRVFFE